MAEKFADILAVGKVNSLGRAAEVVQIVANDKDRLEELYLCLFEDNAWLRMRAIDSLEKVCRVHPEWFELYVDRMFKELGNKTQPSIQWHLAQMFREIDLTPTQKKQAVAWLVERLEDPDVDWIVAANCMDTLVEFTRSGLFTTEKLIPLLVHQQSHRSNAVVKRANKLLSAFR